MKKIIFAVCVLSPLSLYAADGPVLANPLQATAAEIEADAPRSGLPRFWTDFKDSLHEKTGFSFNIDAAFTAQRAAPGGKQTAIQGLYFPSAAWTLFEDARFGSGEIDFNYTISHFWGTEAYTLQERAGVAVDFNDYSTNWTKFTQFTYTHTLPGDLDFLSLSAGQYPIYNFDGVPFMEDMWLWHTALSARRS